MDTNVNVVALILAIISVTDTLTKKEAEVILGGERIILDGFSTNSGNVFSSIPVLDGYSIRLDNTVDYISGIGRIVVGNKSFTDSKQPHKLRIQRIYNGHRLTISEIKILLNEGTVLIDTLDEEGNETKNILQYMKNKQKVSFHRY